MSAFCDYQSVRTIDASNRMNGKVLLRGGTMSFKDDFIKLKVARCLNCGLIKTTTKNDFKCPCCSRNMVDIDEMFKKRMEKEKAQKNEKANVKK